MDIVEISSPGSAGESAESDAESDPESHEYVRKRRRRSGNEAGQRIFYKVGSFRTLRRESTVAL